MSRGKRTALLDPAGFFERASEILGVKNAPEMARKLGISKHAVYFWADGKMPGLTALQNVARIAEVSGVSLHWLLTGKGPKMAADRAGEEGNLLTLDLGQEVLRILRELAIEEGRDVAHAVESIVLEALATRGLLREAGRESVIFYGSEEMTPIRVIGEISGSIITQYPRLQMDRCAPEFRAMERDARALRVRGDSLEDSGMYEGDLVIFAAQADAANGSVVIAQTPKGAMVRTFYHSKGSVILRGRNLETPDLIVEADAIKLLGVVLGIQRATASRTRGLRRV